MNFTLPPSPHWAGLFSTLAALSVSSEVATRFEVGRTQYLYVATEPVIAELAKVGNGSHSIRSGSVTQVLTRPDRFVIASTAAARSNVQAAYSHSSPPESHPPPLPYLDPKIPATTPVAAATEKTPTPSPLLLLAGPTGSEPLYIRCKVRCPH